MREVEDFDEDPEEEPVPAPPPRPRPPRCCSCGDIFEGYDRTWIQGPEGPLHWLRPTCLGMPLEGKERRPDRLPIAPPKCSICDKDLPPAARDQGILTFCSDECRAKRQGALGGGRTHVRKHVRTRPRA